MSTQRVQAKLTAVERVAEAVQSFARQATAAGEQAATLVRRFEQRASDEHRQRITELTRATAARESAAEALRTCKEDCAPLERALSEAQRVESNALQRAEASAKAIATAGEAMERFSAARRTFSTALEMHAPRAVSATQQLSSELQQYLSVGEGDGSARLSGSQPGLLRRAATGTRGMEDVDVRNIVNESTEPSTVENTTREQVAWGLDRLKSVIEPALKLGKGPDYFKARDAAEGLSGDRSYSAVYDSYYGDRAIELTRAAGCYTLPDGDPRVQVARELGIDSLPAVVR